MNLPGNIPYQNELLARLYAEHQSAALKAAATSNLVSPSDSTSSISNSQLSPHSSPVNGSLVNMFSPKEDGQGRGSFLPSHASSFFGGVEGDMDAKTRELAAAAAFAVGGMPSPPGLLRLSSNPISGNNSFNDFAAMSARPLAVRNQS